MNKELLGKIAPKQMRKMVAPALTVAAAVAAISCAGVKAERVTVNAPETQTPSAAAGTPTPDAYQEYLKGYYAGLIPTPTLTPALTPRPLTAEEKGRKLLKEQAGLTAEQGRANARQEQLVKDMCQTANEIYDARTGADQLTLIAQLTGEPVPAPAYSCEEPKPTPTATPKPEVIYVPIPTPYPTATPPPEITGLSLGLRYDPSARNCNIVDRRTGAIVNPAAPTRISYSETGVGITRSVTTHLNPGQFAIIQGWKVDGQGNGVFKVLEAGTQQLSFSNFISDGAVAVVGNEDAAKVELCNAIKAAHDNNWARSNVTIPSGWKAN